VRAVRLFGAAEALLQQLGFVLAPVDWRDFEREVARLRTAMEPPTFAQAWAAGQALSLDDAVADAIRGL
jgi:hypothetical protein